ncbi:MAG: cell division protein FtsQ/DivIB [Proteobacteria bacterium]|nr:cell division protein FtsQ/DivIB [Pseudomonadota bacterium]
MPKLVTRTAFGLLVCGSVLSGASHAVAQGQGFGRNTPIACGDRTAITKFLTDQYAENPTSLGLASNESVFEVFTSKRGSWTVLLTNPNGITCLLGSGEHWENNKRLQTTDPHA